MRDFFNILFTAAGTAVTFLIGGVDLIVQVLIIFMVLDYATGMVKGFCNKTLSSSVGFKGLLKKSMIIVVLILAVMLDNLNDNGQWIFRTMVCYFYIANEGISILENIGGLGVPLPSKLTDAMKQFDKEA